MGWWGPGAARVGHLWGCQGWWWSWQRNPGVLLLLKVMLSLPLGGWGGTLAHQCPLLLLQPAGDGLCECDHGGSCHSTGAQIAHQGKVALGHHCPGHLDPPHGVSLSSSSPGAGEKMEERGCLGATTQGSPSPQRWLRR